MPTDDTERRDQTQCPFHGADCAADPREGQDFDFKDTDSTHYELCQELCDVEVEDGLVIPDVVCERIIPCPVHDDLDPTDGRPS